MTPFFSVLTPSLQRESLVRCCQSVDSQLGATWEHIVALDCGLEEVDQSLIDRCQNPRRHFVCCGKKYGHYGNHARWFGWGFATGKYQVLLDDDNAMYRPDALADMKHCIELDGFPDWALFPIHRHGSVFLLLPPGMCRTDSANIVVKRELGRWPDIEAREADGVLAEHLSSNYAFSAFPDCPPIILMEKSSNGI